MMPEFYIVLEQIKKTGPDASYLLLLYREELIEHLTREYDPVLAELVETNIHPLPTLTKTPAA